MRIRTVKPAMWTDGKIVRLTDGANLLFIALLNQADDEGRLKNDTKEIECKAPRFWERSESLLKELESVGLIQIFGESKEYIQITNFLKHQKIDRPYDSTIPKPFAEHSTNIPRKDRIGKDSKGKDSKGKEKKDYAETSSAKQGSKSKKQGKPATEGYQECIDLIAKRWRIGGMPVKITGEHGKLVKDLLFYGIERAMALLAFYQSDEWVGWGKEHKGLSVRGLRTDLEKMMEAPELKKFEQGYIEHCQSKNVSAILPKLVAVPIESGRIEDEMVKTNG